MNHRRPNRNATSLAAVSLTASLALSLLTAHPAARGRASDVALRLHAMAVRQVTGQAGSVDIVVERWSTDEERQQHLTLLTERGPEKLLEFVQSLPRIGSFGSFQSTGYDVRFARTTPRAGGGQHITLATDRPMPFAERATRPVSADYPFTLIEVDLDANGRGTGQMAVAARFVLDRKTKDYVVEPWDDTPVRLLRVQAVE